MIRALRAEMLKVRTTRLWWALLLALLGLVALSVVLSVVFAGQQGTPGLDTDAAVANVWAGAGAASTFALVIGILVMAGEYRHATIGSTFLGEPRRARVLLAKLLTAGLVGLVYGLVACALTAVLAVPLLRARGATGSADVPLILGGVLLVSVLYALLGAGLGALVRNQVAAIVGALIWIFVAEALLIFLLPRVGRWLPGGAASAITQATATFDTNNPLLSRPAAVAVLLGYAIALAGSGAVLTRRRDIT